ncbi:acetyltransferase component of pyruvate dehydrogenase complex [Sphingobium jiangsuense]|uniref:Dihydrolipoamide acetyltransferase component of pyruvate dehydrogenase complex n=1 Tax=Sphingobium jiangsuense TaxID=870476 RepID=A0A7W6BSC0_9SPHN|nr:dihydrolipoamide acetyltransferase family protein [Sphingobium jiangsuense]MBB3927893.1 pyruvate dehydrogenase E2 component (dihydrolipoamide acetyltransferase) [Sphingobium jiangsuense]GLS98987.1 acetyltransferase component of pyruvate dehydrogenase complex [Sphingobium jiangsuense]
MPIELKMPALSPTMEKGALAKWLVGVGDTVKAGDLIAEIETDKATMEFEAADEGRVAQLLIVEGTDEVAVGTVIALLAGEGEAAPEAEEAAAPPPVREEAPSPMPETVTETAPVAAPVAKAVAVAAPLALDESVAATPLARRIAAMEGLALDRIRGSGPGGKIVKADLGLPAIVAPAAAATAPRAAPEAAPAQIAPPPAGVPVETVRLSTMRRTIARRLTASKQTVPHFYLTRRCNLDPLLRLRGELNAGLAARGVKLSVNDMLVKAMALALMQVPDANVQFGGDELHRFGRVDISMAVAIEGGLITPVIKDAGSLSLSAIAQVSKTLAEKARSGKLMPEDYEGGTASLSNLGMFGVDEMFPVINPPQALILGTAAGIEQPWKVDGGIALATIMAATASFDHRAIDGAIAAQFMAAFHEYVESPMLLLG